MPLHQALTAYVVSDLDEPRLGQQRAYVLPAAVGQQEVVTFRDDQPGGRRDRDRRGDGLLEVSLEAWDVQSPVRMRVQALQRRDLSVDVEGVRRPLAASPPEAVELDVGEVEAVHRQVADRFASEVGA